MTQTPGPTPTPHPVGTINLPIVFVSRQILDDGSIYLAAAKDMPGVGPHSRFRVAAPGKLIVRESTGALRTLVDGSNPTAASLNLIDVNAPDVSYDGQVIVFAGLPNGTYPPFVSHQDPNPGGWRIYTINADGTGLKQITRSDPAANLGLAGLPQALSAYDDTDPAWLPDGRIVLSSTRWPSYSQYSGARTSNLFVVDAEGSNLHRITSERNGADRPIVDPVTGKIVYARWWRNHRFAINDMSTVLDANGGFIQKDGLSAERSQQMDGSGNYQNFLWRNAWQASSINPDGTQVVMWSGATRTQSGAFGNGEASSEMDEKNHMYGGAFTDAGELIANYYPMYNMTEAGGFGGLRKYTRGPGDYKPLLGITTIGPDNSLVVPNSPASYGVHVGSYATDPAPLPDGRIVVSWARDYLQNYGLYVVDSNGANLRLLYDDPNTTELRAKIIRARPLPVIITDTITQVASPLPPPATGPYNQDGTFVFDALNVYANAPVDIDIASAPAVGSASIIRFFVDQQRASKGSFPHLDWPILLAQIPVNPDGSVRNVSAPANVPLFEQIRSAAGTVPFAALPENGGATHVAGMNYGRPGEHVTCVGCHAGHTMIPVPVDPQAARFSNLAPGAQVSVSSASNAQYIKSVVDRRVMKGEIWRYWTSPSGQQAGQWVKLTFPVPVTVRTIRLYNPRKGDEANSTVQVNAATVKLFSDEAGTALVATQPASALAVSGTDVSFADVQARVVMVELTDVTGTFYGANVASLAEVEVIARAEAP